jgi:hypothetical protein
MTSPRAGIGLLRAHPLGVALTATVAVIAAGIAVLTIATAVYQSSGPETIASSTLAEQAAADAQLYVNTHIESVTCPRGTFRAGSRVLCKAELWVGRSQRKSELLSVGVMREEGEIYATITPDRFVAQSADG